MVMLISNSIDSYVLVLWQERALAAGGNKRVCTGQETNRNQGSGQWQCVSCRRVTFLLRHQDLIIPRMCMILLIQTVCMVSC